MTISNLAFRRNSDTSQEISNVRTVGTYEAELFHERTSCFQRAVVDLFPAVENEGLVKKIVDPITSLVEGDDRSEAEDVGQCSDGFSVLESRARVLSNGS